MKLSKVQFMALNFLFCFDKEAYYSLMKAKPEINIAMFRARVYGELL